MEREDAVADLGGGVLLGAADVGGDAPGPSRTKTFVEALAIPDPAPVMTATLPSSRPIALPSPLTIVTSDGLYRPPELHATQYDMNTGRRPRPLEQVNAMSGPPNGVQANSHPQRDSNPCCRRERAVS